MDMRLWYSGPAFLEGRIVKNHADERCTVLPCKLVLIQQMNEHAKEQK